MRFLGAVLCVTLTCCPGQGRADDKPKAGPRSFADEAAALEAQPKNGWVTAEKIKVRPWYVDGEESVYLVLRFKPDREAIQQGKATGKVTVGIDISKDGQAKVIVHPAEGVYELIETKEGRFLRIAHRDVPDRDNPFEKKVGKAEFKVAYQLEDGKLTFPRGLDADYWSEWPATVKQKEAIVFKAR